MRRKGEDTFAMKRRRMPYVAKIKREDPFRSADTREIRAMVKRIAAARETFSVAGWREEYGYRLFHFETWAKARAMQHWIDRRGIAQRPMPRPDNVGPGRRLAMLRPAIPCRGRFCSDQGYSLPCQTGRIIRVNWTEKM